MTRRLAVLVAAVLVVVGALTTVPALAASTDPATCHPSAGTGAYTPASGVTTTGLGADAPAYYEIGRPTGAFLNKPARGIMIVIHGGGWTVTGKASVAVMRPYADAHWRARGWSTVNIDYRPCDKGLSDVLWFMDRLRSLRPSATICAVGESAGGNLALLLASVRPDLACVVSLAGPSDLPAMAGQTAYRPLTGLFESVGPLHVTDMAVAAFGSAEALVWNSPIRYVASVRARVLLATGEHDFAISTAQDANYAAATRKARPAGYVAKLVLAAGDIGFVHSGISATAETQLFAAEAALMPLRP